MNLEEIRKLLFNMYLGMFAEFMKYGKNDFANIARGTAYASAWWLTHANKDNVKLVKAIPKEVSDQYYNVLNYLKAKNHEQN